MPSQRVFRDEDEGPQEADLERFGGETRPCPRCGKDIYDEAEWCHACGHVMSDGADKKVPAWVVVTAATAAAAFIAVLLLR